MKLSFACRAALWLVLLITGSGLLETRGWSAQALVPLGSTWSYLDNGSDQGTAWVSPGFDDSTWNSGPAQLGFGDGDEATLIANGGITAYFRHSFIVTNTASITGLTVRLLRDDGGVVYLNGVEIFRSNMPVGPIAYNTLAVAAVGGGDESTNLFAAAVPPNLLVHGANLLAVEIHQNTITSSDLSFDLLLLAESGSTEPPSIPPTIVSQPQSQTAYVGADVTFSVSATGTEPLHYLWRRNNILIPGATNSNLTLFGVQLTNAGNYSVIVTNAYGSRVSSNAVLQVLIPGTNIPPSVTLFSPSNGVTFPAGILITLRASASDSDGTVTKVEFFEGANKLGQDLTAPYTFGWSNVPPGSYTLTAVATDNSNAVSVSTPVNITVSPSGGGGGGALTLISTGAVWKYLDSGTDQGTAWSGSAFDDSSWAAGPAELGYGEGDEATVVSYGPDAANKYVTTYFRKTFGVTNTANITSLTVRLLADDGGVVYLNGVEVFRNNMPAGPISFNTLAPAASPEMVFVTAAIPPNLLLSGFNVLAVEVHQNAVTSSDLSFNLELVANSGSTTNPPPTAPLIVSQPQSQTVTAGSTVTFNVVATGTPPLVFDWRRNGVPVAMTTNGPLTLSNVQTNDTGNYNVIVSNSYGTAISSNAFLLVLGSGGTNIPPSVTLFSPSNGVTFPAGSSIILRASATDPDNGVQKVEFFANGNKLGEDLFAPYAVGWSNVPPGNYQLTAAATDNANAVTVSAPVNITVSPSGGGGGGALTLISTGAVWKYLDNGTDQGTAWIAPAFDDSGWAVGAAQLGYGDGDEATIVSFGPDASNKYITTYFRRQFAVTNAASITGLTVRLLRDDGGVVYLNGVEVFRSNMPTGPVTFHTLAMLAVDEFEYVTVQVPAALLVSGLNTVAVEIHQVNPASSDLSFDLELVAHTGSTTPPGLPPTIVTQPQSRTVLAGSTTTFTVGVTGTPPFTYRWRRNGAVVAITTNGSLTLFNVQTNQAGLYSVLVTNLHGFAISSNALLTVIQSNRPPVAFSQSVTLNEDSLRAITLTGSDPDGNPITFAIVSPPSHGSLTILGTNRIYQPQPNYFGPDSFTFKANDGQLDSVPATISITVLPVNDPPVARALATPLTTLFRELTGLLAISPNNTSASLNLDASGSSDVENDPLVFVWLENPTFVATGAVVTAELELGEHSLTLVADDGSASGTDVVNFEVVTAAEAVDLILIKVENSGLRRWILRPLLASLRAARSAFEDGEFATGAAWLEVFQRKVDARVRPIDPDLADSLSTAAQRIIDAVSTP